MIKSLIFDAYRKFKATLRWLLLVNEAKQRYFNYVNRLF